MAHEHVGGIRRVDAAEQRTEQPLVPGPPEAPDQVALDVAQTERLAAFFSRHAVRHATFISETGDHYLTVEGKQKVASFVNEWCRGAHAVEKPTLPPFMSTQ
jgi:hypothetical protein